MTIYVCDDDRALGFADWLFSSIRRLGKLKSSDLTPQQVEMLAKLPQVQIVQVKAQTDFVGHGYFHSSPAVSSDVILLTRDQLSPGAESGRPLRKRSDNFWEIDDRYPQFSSN